MVLPGNGGGGPDRNGGGGPSGPPGQYGGMFGREIPGASGL